jgi:hypothetical protein
MPRDAEWGTIKHVKDQLSERSRFSDCHDCQLLVDIIQELIEILNPPMSD